MEATNLHKNKFNPMNKNPLPTLVHVTNQKLTVAMLPSTNMASMLGCGPHTNDHIHLAVEEI